MKIGQKNFYLWKKLILRMEASPLQETMASGSDVASANATCNMQQTTLDIPVPPAVCIGICSRLPSSEHALSQEEVRTTMEAADANAGNGCQQCLDVTTRFSNVLVPNPTVSKDPSEYSTEPSQTESLDPSSPFEIPAQVRITSKPKDESPASWNPTMDQPLFLIYAIDSYPRPSYPLSEPLPPYSREELEKALYWFPSILTTPRCPDPGPPHAALLALQISSSSEMPGGWIWDTSMTLQSPPDLADFDLYDSSEADEKNANRMEITPKDPSPGLPEFNQSLTIPTDLLDFFARCESLMSRCIQAYNSKDVAPLLRLAASPEGGGISKLPLGTEIYNLHLPKPVPVHISDDDDEPRRQVSDDEDEENSIHSPLGHQGILEDNSRPQSPLGRRDDFEDPYDYASVEWIPGFEMDRFRTPVDGVIIVEDVGLEGEWYHSAENVGAVSNTDEAVVADKDVSATADSDVALTPAVQAYGGDAVFEVEVREEVLTEEETETETETESELASSTIEEVDGATLVEQAPLLSPAVLGPFPSLSSEASFDSVPNYGGDVQFSAGLVRTTDAADLGAAVLTEERTSPTRVDSVPIFEQIFGSPRDGEEAEVPVVSRRRFLGSFISGRYPFDGDTSGELEVLIGGRELQVDEGEVRVEFGRRWDAVFADDQRNAAETTAEVAVHIGNAVDGVEPGAEAFGMVSRDDPGRIVKVSEMVPSLADDTGRAEPECRKSVDEHAGLVDDDSLGRIIEALGSFVGDVETGNDVQVEPVRDVAGLEAGLESVSSLDSALVQDSVQDILSTGDCDAGRTAVAAEVVERDDCVFMEHGVLPNVATIERDESCDHALDDSVVLEHGVVSTGDAVRTAKATDVIDRGDVRDDAVIVEPGVVKNVAQAGITSAVDVVGASGRIGCGVYERIAKETDVIASDVAVIAEPGVVLNLIAEAADVTDCVVSRDEALIDPTEAVSTADNTERVVAEIIEPGVVSNIVEATIVIDLSGGCDGSVIDEAGVVSACDVDGASERIAESTDVMDCDTRDEISCAPVGNVSGVGSERTSEEEVGSLVKGYGDSEPFARLVVRAVQEGLMLSSEPPLTSVDVRTLARRRVSAAYRGASDSATLGATSRELGRIRQDHLIATEAVMSRPTTRELTVHLMRSGPLSGDVTEKDESVVDGCGQANHFSCATVPGKTYTGLVDQVTHFRGIFLLGFAAVRFVVCAVWKISWFGLGVGLMLEGAHLVWPSLAVTVVARVGLLGRYVRIWAGV
ncbi:hypothetical protein HDU97_001583 [Phlyctochytrium planicorne]|nr:hypothetical protein HDU97_001583 [Phlyctochytrium planicorne]